LCNITGIFPFGRYTTAIRPSRAGKDAYLNTAYQNNPVQNTNPIPAAPPVRTVERKVGRATFIVSSRFNDEQEKDIVSTIARLVQHGGKPD
jgi:hypothetical protein